MTVYKRREAVRVAAEHNELRQRIAQLENEAQRRAAAAASTRALQQRADALDTTDVERLRQDKDELHAQIADLEHHLAELRTLNVTELYHEFLRLDGRRAQLLSENAGLRNIIAHQSRPVLQVANEAAAQDALRRRNDEHNATMRADAALLKRKRVALQQEVRKLMRQEARLKRELDGLPTSPDRYADELQRVHAKIQEQDGIIGDLEHEIATLESKLAVRHDGDDNNGNDDKATATTPHATADVELTQLRGEYVRLKEQLQQQQQQQQHDEQARREEL